MNKKLIVLAMAFSISATAYANPSLLSPTLKTEMDKVSYAIGYDIGNGFKTQGLAIEPDPFHSGFQAGLSGKTPVMTTADMQATLTQYQKEMMQQAAQKQQAAAATNLTASTAYLQKISTQADVKELAPGLYYKVLTPGTGKIPGPKDTVTVNYEGTLVNGTVFDSSYQRGQPASFQVGQVIPGWTKTLEKMPVGSIWMVYIAPDLAYGAYAPPQIGPNQALTFKIDLISIGAPKAVKSGS